MRPMRPVRTVSPMRPVEQMPQTLQMQHMLHLPQPLQTLQMCHRFNLPNHWNPCDHCNHRYGSPTDAPQIQPHPPCSLHRHHATLTLQRLWPACRCRFHLKLLLEGSRHGPLHEWRLSACFLRPTGHTGPLNAVETIEGACGS